MGTGVGKGARGALIAGGLLAGLVGPVATGAGQSVAGAPAAGVPAFEFVGRLEQVGGDFTLRGYVTHLAGVPDAALFTGPGDQSEATARVTIVARAKLRTRAILDNIFVITATGRATFRVRPGGGASFADPASFARGRTIGSARLRMQSVLNVQAPDAGIATVSGTLVQTTSAQVVLGGRRYRFGRVRLGLRLSASGQGTRSEPTLPRATIVMGGSATRAG
jgi:hypothetical protein